MFTLLVTAIVLCIAALLGGRHIIFWARLLILARKLPGPKTVPLLGNTELLTASFKDLEPLAHKYFQEYPRFFTCWASLVPVILLRDPRGIEVVLGSGRKNVKKSFLYKFWKPLLGNGLGIIEGAKWEQHRKLLTPAFNNNMLENFVEVFTRKSEILVQKLEKEVGKKNFDVSTYIFRAVNDMINETIMKMDSKSLDNDEDSVLITNTNLVGKLIMKRTLSPWLYPDFIYWNSSTGKECKKLCDFTLNYAKEVIKNRRQELKISNKSRQLTAEDDVLNTKKKSNFLDLLLEASEYGNQLSEMEVIDEVRQFLIVGYITVRVALCWVIQILGNHPEIQDKIYEELENTLQGSDRTFNMKDLNDMKYLQSVIKEGLRLYPSLPVMIDSTIRDLELDGYTIPAGMIIGISIYHTHRNPEFYPDPEKFDPDRFLPQSMHRHPYAYMPFSLGLRNCIGQKYAMLQMKTMLSYIIRNFKIKSMRENLKPSLEVVIISEEGFYISVLKRNPKNVT